MDASNIFVQEVNDVLQLIIIHDHSVFTAHYFNVPAFAKDCVAYMKLILGMSTPTFNIFENNIIMHIPETKITMDTISIIFHRRSDVTLNVSEWTFFAPVLRRQSESEKYMFVYRYGTFLSGYPDSNRKILRKIKQLAIVSPGSEEKFEIYDKISKANDWIDALNAAYEINLLFDDDDLMTAIMKFMGRNSMMIHAESSNIKHTIVGGKHVLSRFSIMFSICNMIGELRDISTAYGGNYNEIVKLKKINGWRDRKMCMMYSL